MRTLLSINNYYYRRGGAEVVFLEQNRLFAEHGWNVIPFAMQHQNNLATPWSVHFAEEIEYGQRYSLWQKLARVPKVIYSLEARRKLGRLVDQVRPDVAHAHNIYHHLSPSILGALKERGIPVVLTLHDLKLACPAYKMWRPGGVCERCKGGALYNVLRYRCIKNSSALSALVLLEAAVHEVSGVYRRDTNRFVVPSQFYLQKLLEWGWDRERLVHIPNFVDVKSLRPDFTAGKAFLYVGRLVPEKGLGTLIRASIMADVPVWIAGAGPEDEALRRLAEKLGADVTFLGHCNGEVLHDAVRSARAVVLPSEWYENAPMSVMEAYALGKPVIGAAIGGIPELIREPETGITFESGNAEALAVALRQLTGAPDRQLADMARAGRAWMEADFTVERYRDRVLELYQQLGVQTATHEALNTAGATNA